MEHRQEEIIYQKTKEVFFQRRNTSPEQKKTHPLLRETTPGTTYYSSDISSKYYSNCCFVFKYNPQLCARQGSPFQPNEMERTHDAINYLRDSLISVSYAIATIYVQKLRHLRSKCICNKHETIATRISVFYQSRTALKDVKSTLNACLGTMTFQHRFIVN